MFGSEIWPQTSDSPLVILLLLAASVFAVSSATIHSPISQHRPALKLYHQLVHGLNSLLVWFQRRVWSADGFVSWPHNTMSNRCQEGWIGGGYFHLLQAPFSAVVAKKHCLHAPSLVSRRVGHRRHIGCCLLSSGKDVSAMCRWCIIHQTA